jgi:hypothetical protein
MLLASCAKTDIPQVIVPYDGGASDTDTDTDADTDTDTDADTDTDTDTDTGTDTETDTSDGCMPNSGWPCPCTLDPLEECDDGSDCVILQSLEEYGGYCAAQCEGGGDDCPDQPYAAEGMCALSDMGENYWCILVCASTSECPPTQECVYVSSSMDVCL